MMNLFEINVCSFMWVSAFIGLIRKYISYYKLHWQTKVQLCNSPYASTEVLDEKIACDKSEVLLMNFQLNIQTNTMLKDSMRKIKR